MSENQRTQRRNRIDLEMLGGRRGDQEKHAIRWGDIEYLVQRITSYQIAGDTFVTDAPPIEDQVFVDANGETQNLVNYLMGTAVTADAAAGDAQQALADAESAAQQLDGLVDGFTRGTLGQLEIDYQSALDAASNSDAARIAAETARSGAETAETNAATSATSASGSASSAATSATNAANSANEAGDSADAAASSASAASTSSTNAGQSATAANSSAVAANTSATNAGVSETNAASSETNAAGSAASALSSKNLAASILADIQNEETGLAADINNIQGLNVDSLSGTALATFLTQMNVDAGGTSATVTNQGSAIANLEGYVTATATLTAETSGGKISGIRATVYDGEGGASSGSLLELLGDDVIAEGTISASRLVVSDFSGNLVGNGSFVYGDKRGWLASSGGVADTYQGKTCIRFDTHAAHQYAYWSDDHKTPVSEGDYLSLSFRGATTAGGTADLRVSVAFYDSIGGAAFAWKSNLQTFNTTAWAYSTKQIAVPAGALYAHVYIARNAGGSGSAYMTDIEVLRSRPGTTLITPNSITTNELAADSVTANEINVVSLDAVSATIGTFKSAETGERIEISDDRIVVYDALDQVRVKIGNLT